MYFNQKWKTAWGLGLQHCLQHCIIIKLDKNYNMENKNEFSLLELEICTKVLTKIIQVIKEKNALTAGILEMAISTVNLIKEMPVKK